MFQLSWIICKHKNCMNIHYREILKWHVDNKYYLCNEYQTVVMNIICINCFLFLIKLKKDVTWILSPVVQNTHIRKVLLAWQVLLAKYFMLSYKNEHLVFNIEVRVWCLPSMLLDLIIIFCLENCMYSHYSTNLVYIRNIGKSHLFFTHQY